MPSFEEARQIILDHVAALGVERVALLEAAGRVLGEDVAAPWDFPAWNNSAMDGYAVRAEELTPGASARIVGYIPAGAAAPEPLAAGTAAKILTGAPVPAGADAIVPLEDAEEQDGWVTVRAPVRPGAHVRRKGEDLRAGETVLRSGALLGPAEVSLLASCGRLAVPVIRRPRVAILSTGDELAEPGEPLRPGKIYDSNSLAVAAAVTQLGGVPTLLPIARDEKESLTAIVAEGLRADALITTAGVSMGDRDLVRHALDELGVRQVFWKIDVKPGRPTAFALRGRTPVFSLPGNPVSTLLMFEQFVRPALLRMAGHRHVLRPLVRARLEDPVSRKPGRVSLLRVRLERRDGELVAFSAGNQDTGILRTMLLADAIAVVPAHAGDLPRGAAVDVQVLRPGFEASGA